MSFRKIVLFWVFICLAVSSYSQFDIIINGAFPGAEGKKVRLFQYSDNITFRTKLLASTEINHASEFILKFILYQPQEVFLRIDHAKINFYVEPGEKYNIVFDTVNFDEIDIKRNPYLDPLVFNYTFNSTEKPTLNSHIESLEIAFDDFLVKNLSTNRRRQLANLFRKFNAHTDSVFGNIDNEYFKSYYEYKFGRYYRLANAESDYLLAIKYFFDRDILYSNTQYMDFFNSYFETFVLKGSRKITIQDLEFTVNELGSYTALMDSLGKDSLLRNEVLRELVLIKSMDNLFYNKDFNQKNVEVILNQVVENSKFRKHKEIAENILWTKNYLKPGSKSPDFKITDNSGNIYSLSDFSGKFLYISFYTSWCIPCMEEFPIKEVLYSRYNDFIEFVSVSVDRHITQYDQFKRKNNYSWKFFHFDDNFDLLDDFHVRAFPLFVLISPDGKIVSHPSLAPSEAIQGYFEYLKHLHNSKDRNERQKIYQEINK
jgi:thiol-disulfide isomerase/thioredoxin